MKRKLGFCLAILLGLMCLSPPVYAAMSPGKYTGSGFGNSIIDPIVVEVTVGEDDIQNITVVSAPRETGPILQSAIDTLIPRMIAHQSVAIDATTGATASSRGIRMAVRDALTQALEAGGGKAEDISSFEIIPAKSDATETVNVDVLVVGMGGSGCAAAMRAAEGLDANGGGKVLAIDKAAKYGGTSANCAEPMAVNAPRYKEMFNNGADYMDKESMRAAWLDYVNGGNKPEMLDLFLDNSGETIDWLFFEHGFVFNNPTTGFAETDIWNCKYQYVFNGNAEEGRDYGIELQLRNEQVDGYFHNIMEDYQELGGQIMLETEAYELLYDADSQSVAGVKARGYDGTEYTINAKAVILATGGFAGNGDMEKEYFDNPYWPIQSAWGTYGWGLSHNDGKMIQAAIDIGAGTFNIDMPPMVHFATTASYITDFPVNINENPGFELGAWWYGWTPVWSLNDVPIAMGLSGDVLQVDKNGARFADENGLFQWWKAGSTFKAIWSDAQVKKVMEEGFENPASALAQGQGGVPANTPIPEMYDIIEAAIKKGYVHKADTLDELAEMTGMNADTLKKTVANYNALCAAGEDSQFGKDPSMLWALGDQGPWYAVDCASAVYSTCGALDVDTQIRVLQADGKTPIGGLYAVGNDSGGVLYTNTKEYVTYGGAALGWAFTSGRLAGGNAAEYAKTR